jgi:copper chaperone
MNMITFQVPGMTCGHCARTITNALQEIDPAAQVNIDLASKRVAVTSTLTSEAVRTAIGNAGYDAGNQSD